MTISTLSFNSASRSSMLRLQTELRDATQEVNTSRHADIGRTLGRLTGSTVSARVNETSLDKILESNKLVGNRLELADDAMASIVLGAEAVLASLINGTADATSLKATLFQSTSGLQQLTGALNLSVGGQFIFAGDQADRQPISAYDVAVPPAQSPSQATKDSFAAFVLAATGGTDAKTVAAADLKAYLTSGYPDSTTPTHRFDDLFDDANWGARWSQASDTVIQSSISKTETIASSLSANETAFRRIAAAYTLINEIGSAELGESALQVAKDAAYSKLKTGIDEVVRLQADVGVKLGRIDRSNESVAQQKDILTATVAALEEIDLYEASQKITRLETQLEAAYTITGRLQKLNILDYI